MATDYKAQPVQHFSGVESKACQPLGLSTLLGGQFLLPLSTLLRVSTCTSLFSLCLCSCLSHAHLSCLYHSFSDSHPRPSWPLPLISTNHPRREALSGRLSACSDQRGFLCASPCDSSSEGSIPSIRLCICSRLPTLPGPLALFYNNNNTVGGNHLGWGDADGTKAELKAAPPREEGARTMGPAPSPPLECLSSPSLTSVIIYGVIKCPSSFTFFSTSCKTGGRSSVPKLGCRGGGGEDGARSHRLHPPTSLPFRLTLKVETVSDFPCCVDLSPRAVCSEIKGRHTGPAGRGDRRQAKI